MTSIGGIGILGAKTLAGGVTVDHGVHGSGRYAKEKPGSAQFFEVTQVILPVGLGDYGYLVSVRLKDPAYHGCAE